MLVLRGEMLYDLEASPDTPDGVAAIAGDQVRDDEPLPAPANDAAAAEDEAGDSSERR
ncbi:MAG: hypothetical protein ACXWK9_05145 [Myxococcaceae bacterium]